MVQGGRENVRIYASCGELEGVVVGTHEMAALFCASPLYG